MSKHKLLLADDSITIQKVVNLTFADEGIDVISVSDGDAAMEKIREIAPDLILADVNMPGLNGYQICEQIKQNADGRAIPVILLVGSFEPFDEAEAYRVGADDYLTKPFQSIRQLVSKVTELLEASKSAENNSAEQTVQQENDNEETDDSLADTERFQLPDINSFQLDDVGMDDEMIQTNQIGSGARGEEQQFATGASGEKFGETAFYQSNYAEYETINETPMQNFSTETSSAKVEAAGSESFYRAPEFNSTVYDFSAETQSSEYRTEELPEELPEDISQRENLSNEDFAPPTFGQTEMNENNSFGRANSAGAEFFDRNSQSSPVLEFDELDLLEVPPLAHKMPGDNNDDTDELETPSSEDFAVPPFASPQAPTTLGDDGEEEPEPEISTRENKANESNLQLPPETIEIIAQKVSERISDKVIREIAMELIPQLTEAIVKKMTKENSKK